jgi:hypothetical protein
LGGWEDEKVGAISKILNSFENIPRKALITINLQK